MNISNQGAHIENKRLGARRGVPSRCSRPSTSIYFTFNSRVGYFPLPAQTPPLLPLPCRRAPPPIIAPPPPPPSIVAPPPICPPIPACWVTRDKVTLHACTQAGEVRGAGGRGGKKKISKQGEACGKHKRVGSIHGVARGGGWGGYSIRDGTGNTLTAEAIIVQYRGDGMGDEGYPPTRGAGGEG